jgi:hypothetical protein
MKKIVLSALLLAAVSFGLTSCLKDKGFENGEYGINDPDTQPPGVGFPRGAAAKYTIGIDLKAEAQVLEGIVFVNLESGKPATSDVHIKLEYNDAIRVAYNNATGATMLQMDPSLVSTTLDLVIPAGERYAQVPITFIDANTLDPNETYGVGLTIVSVDGGYRIAENLKNLLIEVGVKNKYDGIYRLKAYGNLGGNTSAPFLVSTTCGYGLTLETIGPNSVRLSNQPLWRGGAFFDGFCNVNFDFHFNPANDNLSSVTGWSDCPPSAPIAVNFPATSPNFPQLGVPGYNSRYDPATKTIYMAAGLNNNQNWIVVDTLIYCGPR